MGYLHIDNLYKNPDILYCYALEKIHGTSAHLLFKTTDGISTLSFFSGGEKHERFVSLFDAPALLEKFQLKAQEGEVFVYGEAYGGKQQGMSQTYGPELRFTAFDVKINNVWLDVPSAEGFCKGFGLDFIPYERIPLTLDALNAERDRDSIVAVTPGKPREGIVIRPIREQSHKDGSRVIYKHKRKEFMETKTPREVDPAKLQILSDANMVADEWVVPMRIEHVLQKTPFNSDADTGSVIRAMIEDVRRESEGEVVWSKEVEKAIGRATAQMLHRNRLQDA